jgi:hypothetical protein
MNFLSGVICSLAMSLNEAGTARTGGVNRGCCLCARELFCGVVWAVTYLRKLGVSADMGEVAQHQVK